MVFTQNMLHQLGYLWPLQEPDFYRFLRTLKLAGLNERFEVLLEAITFCRYSSNILALHDLTVSKRCLGAVVDSVPGKVQQAEPLTVTDVKKLHRHLDHGSCGTRFSVELAFSTFIHVHVGVISFMEVAYVWISILKGQLHALTWRCRYTRQCELLQTDSNFGLAGHNWIAVWIEALKCIGMDPMNETEGRSLMPAPSEDGSALKRSLESDEASI